MKVCDKKFRNGVNERLDWHTLNIGVLQNFHSFTRYARTPHPLPNSNSVPNRTVAGCCADPPRLSIGRFPALGRRNFDQRQFRHSGASRNPVTLSASC
jgi:hypothetical protein